MNAAPQNSAVRPLLHCQNFDAESQPRIWRNDTRNSTLAIGSLRQTSQLRLASHIDVLNALRPACRALAAKLNRKKEFKRLDGIIGAPLETQESKNVHGKQGLARAAGRPYDSGRLLVRHVVQSSTP